MTKAKKEYLQIYFDKEIKEQLRLLAEANCRSMAEQVVYLIKKAVQDQGTK